MLRNKRGTEKEQELEGNIGGSSTLSPKFHAKRKTDSEWLENKSHINYVDLIFLNQTYSYY